MLEDIEENQHEGQMDEDVNEDVDEQFAEEQVVEDSRGMAYPKAGRANGTISKVGLQAA